MQAAGNCPIGLDVVGNFDALDVAFERFESRRREVLFLVELDDPAVLGKEEVGNWIAPGTLALKRPLVAPEVGVDRPQRGDDPVSGRCPSGRW